MSTHYHQLLDAAIRHLEQLRSQGVRYVPASPAVLSALAEAPPRGPRVASAPQSNPAAQTESKPPAVDLSVPVETPVAKEAAPASKTQAMAELRQRALACVKCPQLASSRKNVVFGVGDVNSPLLFVGEAPGAEED